MAEQQEGDRFARQENPRVLADVAAIVDDSPNGVCVSQDDIIVYANAAWVELLNAGTIANAVGRPLGDFHSPAVMAMVHERCARAPEHGDSAPAEYAVQRPDGTSVRVEAVTARTQWAGRPAFRTTLRTVTASRTADAAVHYRAALVEHVSDAIISTTTDGIVTSWNPAAETIYGLAPQQVLGRPVSDVVGAMLSPASVVGAGGIAEALHRRADGSALAIRVSAAEMASGFVLVCTDETARRRAEHNFATVVDALNEGVSVVGPTGVIESINPAVLRIMGLTPGQAVGALSSDWPLFDTTGAPIEYEDRPSVSTRRTGEPRYDVVVRTRRGDGRTVWLSLSSRSLTPDSAGPHRVMLSFTDITESRANREKLEHDATCDPLTGLANRNRVLDHLETALRAARPATRTGVLFIDLDNFKIINDSLGHGVGDAVLQVVGRRLRQVARPDDLVGRLGGDEFVIVVADDRGDLAEIHSLAASLRASVAAPVEVGDRRLHVDASIGIALASHGDPRSASDILRDADVAMYQAKTRGNGRIETFDVQLRERMQRRLLLQEALREAVPADQLWMAYQPIVDLASREVVAAEGLLRWSHPVHGHIGPTEFIPLAEQTGLIHDIGAYTFRTAFTDLAAHRVRRNSSIRLKVNLSARQLEDPDLQTIVQTALADAGLPAHAVSLEVTESALIHDPDAAAKILGDLRGLGLTLAIDDFGTGYSSLAQVLQLPLDALKIDRSLIARIADDPDATNIVKSIIAMAHAVGLTVIAEGVETAKQLKILSLLRCDQAQGFHLGRPSPISEFPNVTTAAPPAIGLALDNRPSPGVDRLNS